jgi:hypothetical protein
MQQRTSTQRDTVSQTVAANVRAEAARHEMRNVDVAPHLDITAGQVGRKMRGVVPFTIDELGVLALLWGHKHPNGDPDISVFVTRRITSTSRAVA